MNRYNTDLKSLEIVRFGLSITILVWHFQNFFSPISPENWEPIRTNQPFYWFLKPLYDNGFIAVQVFWFISGIIFFKIYANGILTAKVSWKKFIYNRFTRLYPLHFLTLLIVLVLELLYFKKNGYYLLFNVTPLDFFKNLLFIQNWSGFNYSFNGPSWSVSVEILVYVLFFFFAQAGFFSKLRNTAILFLIVLIVKRLNLVFYPNILSCLYFFIIGCLSIHIFDLLTSGKQKLLYIIAITIVYLVLEKTKLILSEAVWNLSLRTLFLGFSLVYPFMYLFNYIPALDKMPAKYFTAVGNLTYSTYLMHFPMQLCILTFFMKAGDPVLFSKWFFFFYILLSILLGIVTYHFFERKAKFYLRKFA